VVEVFVIVDVFLIERVIGRPAFSLFWMSRNDTRQIAIFALAQSRAKLTRGVPAQSEEGNTKLAIKRFALAVQPSYCQGSCGPSQIAQEFTSGPRSEIILGHAHKARIVRPLASSKTGTKKAAESGLCPRPPDQQLTCVRAVHIAIERHLCQTGILEKNL